MKKILIVEDEPSYIQLLSDQLSRKDYQVLKAGNGKQGLEIALQETPDLILLDIKMPIMDGMTMLSLLRQNERGKKMKVVMLTNLEPDVKIIGNVIRDQPTYYFVKSDVKISDLLEKIEELV